MNHERGVEGYESLERQLLDSYLEVGPVSKNKSISPASDIQCDCLYGIPSEVLT